MLIIGLTGPSGAGKSEVGNILTGYGIRVLNADEIYHGLLVPPSDLLNELVARFGASILAKDGGLDRKKLGEIVFADPSALSDLNHISHKYVLEIFRNRIAKMQQEQIPAVVLDAPQLFESGADRMCNLTVSVLANPETRIERICARDGIDRVSAEKRIAAQKNDAFFRENSDYIIENDGSPEDLETAVRTILSELGVVPL